MSRIPAIRTMIRTRPLKGIMTSKTPRVRTIGAKEAATARRAMAAPVARGTDIRDGASRAPKVPGPWALQELDDGNISLLSTSLHLFSHHTTSISSSSREAGRRELFPESVHPAANHGERSRGGRFFVPLSRSRGLFVLHSERGGSGGLHAFQPLETSSAVRFIWR